ncbi:unnamed protein product [marine sediment metagenome]|uniref:Uncharacterized protein n=1 Tax=marine sediment metagenome TaxID=412755 RepID=X1AZZ0_9ZZZZ
MSAPIVINTKDDDAGNSTGGATNFSTFKYTIPARKIKKPPIIFFLIAEFCEGFAALVTSPERIINSLFTWQLFHMFSVTTLIILLIFELAWYFETHGFLNQKQITNSLLVLTLFFIIMIFLLFHDYSMSQGIQGIYVDLEITSILQKAIFEDGQSPLIPWLSFSIVGGLLASFLDLPYENKDGVFKKKG